MAIKKQEFYEGAALHQLIRVGGIESVQWEEPFFVINKEVSLYLKYSTKQRSPWGFSFGPQEQSTLARRAKRRSALTIGLICGSDGVASLDYTEFLQIVLHKSTAQHVSCHRHHGEHYEIKGPDGPLYRKIPPLFWPTILDRGRQ